jgi:hypothetical protein
MPRLAVNRKDTGGESIGGKVPRTVHFSPRPLKALSLWQYRGRQPVTRHSGARHLARTRNPDAAHCSGFRVHAKTRVPE